MHCALQQIDVSIFVTVNRHTEKWETKMQVSVVRKLSLVLCLLGSSHAVYAQDEDSSFNGISISGGLSFTSDYRFRGISQTENGFAIQGNFDIAHESGLYAGTWASNLSGWGTFGGTNTEVDLYAGYATDIGDTAADVGIVFYVFPEGSSRTSYYEIYGSLGWEINQFGVGVGINYAPSQDSLSLNDDNQDNLYLYGDLSYAIADTPISLSAHLGYSDGNEGAGPNGWVPSPTGSYLDWSLGVSFDIPWAPVSLSATYVDTDISKSEAEAYQLVNSGYRYGIGKGTVVFAVSGSF